MFAVKRRSKVFDLDKSVRGLLSDGRIANAIQAAESLREAGARAKLWGKDGPEDIRWRRQSDTFRTFVPGPLYRPGSAAVKDLHGGMALTVAPASDFYEVTVATEEGADRLRHLTADSPVVCLDPRSIKPGEYTGTIVEMLSKRVVLDKVPFTVDERNNASPAVLDAPLRAVVWKLLSNGVSCAGFKVEVQIKPSVYFDEKGAKALAKKMQIKELRAHLKTEGGIKKNLVTRYVDVKRREAEGEGGEPFPVKGVCDAAGALNMTLPGGRCLNVTAAKVRHASLKRTRPLKLPGPAPPEIHYLIAAPKTLCLSFNASQMFAGVQLPAATRVVVLDAGGLRSGKNEPNPAAFEFLRASPVPVAFAAWDDGTSFPWTLEDATEDTLATFFETWGKCARTRARPMLAKASDVLVVANAQAGPQFPADGLRTFMREYPEQTFHVLVALEGPDSNIDEAVSDVAAAATGCTFYVAPPGPNEEEAPAPAPAPRDFGPEPTLDEGGLADLFDSI